MIIEGFDIEHWSCIKKASVANLPPTGVVVLHAPNQTGKSSIVKALRACLMDYPSNSAAVPIKGSFPRGTDLKPTVTVAFRTNGVRYRVTKTFGTNKSELRRLADDGDWKPEAASAADVHRLVSELSGGDKSDKGLHELLWPPQGTFKLPDKFDDGVAGRLRGILGVLQTPLDDAFHQRVKERWNNWHSGERKPGKEASLKKNSSLFENKDRLEKLQVELDAMEAKFREVEGFLRRIGELESRRIDLANQLDHQRAERRKCSEAFEKSRERIAAWRLASERYSRALEGHRAALKEQDDRKRAGDRLAEVERDLPSSLEKVEIAVRLAELAAIEAARLHNERVGLLDRRRESQDRASRVAARLNELSMHDRLESVKKELDRAAAVEAKIKQIEQLLADRPAPDEVALAELQANRRAADAIRAERNAASIRLTMHLNAGVDPATITVDGKSLVSSTVESAELAVRRNAEVKIPGWGRIAVHRGSDSGSIDDIEKRLKDCETKFADAVTPFGISANDPNALDLLLVRSMENKQCKEDLAARGKELEELAPKGMAALQTAVVVLETKLKDSPAAEPDANPLPFARQDLESLAASLDREIKNEDAAVLRLEGETKKAADELDLRRNQESVVREELVGLQVDVKSKKDTLAELSPAADLEERVKNAKLALDQSQLELNETKLSEEETAFEARFKEIDASIAALDQEIRENEATYNTIKGGLSREEGLHGRRAAAAAKVERLRQLIEDEELERAAVDRLYELFDECRDKRFQAVQEPIHARVLNWMKTLGLGDYSKVKSSEGFLPEILVHTSGGEFALHEESTGAQEQFAMLVRLALGSILSSADDPAVAILDDPLTHSDVGRLAKMRGILRRASEGDPNSIPPAGPLQIVILTCHPEWFRDERATVIDLEDPAIMQRSR